MGMVMKSIQKLSIVFDSFPPMLVGKIMATYWTYDDFQASYVTVCTGTIKFILNCSVQFVA